MPKPVDVDVATSWTQGRLVFHALPLTQAVAEVNRYSHERIELVPGPVGGQPITAAFNAGDTEAFVAAMAELHDLKVTRPEKGVIRLSEARTKDAYR